jgi:hypothetical protein
VPEPSHHQPSQEHPHAFAIGIHDVRTGPLHDGALGERVLLRTDRGDIQAILHQSPEAQHGVIWVCGARGGFGGPGRGVYTRLAEGLRRDRISSLRLCYRHPNVLPECALDVLAGVAYLTQGGAQPVVLVGHSFGGAVVITAPRARGMRTWRASWHWRRRRMAHASRGSWRRVRCWWCIGQPTRDSRTPAACRFTPGRRSPNSWSCSRAPNTAWTNAPQRWTSC